MFYVDQMNESTENSLQQFVNIEREILTQNNADSLHHQEREAAVNAIEELGELRQQRLDLMFKHNDGPQMMRQQNPPFTSLGNNATPFNGKRIAGSSNEPAETEETEQISAAAIQSPASNFLASNSSTPLNNIQEDPLLLQRLRPNSASKTPLSLFGPLNVPNFKQAELPQPPAKQQFQPITTGNNNSRPMFQSTPQQRVGALHATMAGTKRKSHNLHTPGGHPVSPIAEEGREDLDLNRMVGDIAKMCGEGGDKLVQKLATQLRDLIAQWDWAQARHRHVAKIYFERQQEELNTGWEKLHEEIAKFNDQKNAEHARIAKIRSEIQTERAKGTAKKDAARIKELEAEVAKWKAKANGYGQKISEQNIRIRELKGEVDVREQTYDENMIKIRKYAQQLFDIGQTNARLETKVKSLQEKLEKEQQKNVDAQNKQQQQQPTPGIGPRATLLSHYNQNAGGGTRTNSSSTGSSSNGQPFIRRNNSASTYAQTANPPSGRMHRSNSENGAGMQQSGRPRVRFADDNTIQRQQPQIGPQFSLNGSSSSLAFNTEIAALNKRFGIPADMMNTMYQMTDCGLEYTFTDGPQRVVVTELNACQQHLLGRQCLLYEYPLADGSKNFRWISGPLGADGQANNNISATQRVQVEYKHEERLYEMRTHSGNILRFLLDDGQIELYWADGNRTFVLANGERWEFYSPTSRDFHMEIYPPTGAIAYRIGASTGWNREEFERNTGNQQLDNNNLLLGGRDFKLRRIKDAHTMSMKVQLNESNVEGGPSIQLWLCMDNMLLVKHVQGGSQREKRVCFSHGQCPHIRLQ